MSNDKPIVNCALKNWNSLYYVSEILKGDREVVMTDVQKDGMNLQYDSDELRKDKETVLMAIRQNHMDLAWSLWMVITYVTLKKL